MNKPHYHFWFSQVHSDEMKENGCPKNFCSIVGWCGETEYTDAVRVEQKEEIGLKYPDALYLGIGTFSKLVRQ